MAECKREPKCPGICMCNIADRIVNQNLETQVRGQEEDFTDKQLKRLHDLFNFYFTDTCVKEAWTQGFMKGFYYGQQDGRFE